MPRAMATCASARRRQDLAELPANRRDVGGGEVKRRGLRKLRSGDGAPRGLHRGGSTNGGSMQDLIHNEARLNGLVRAQAEDARDDQL